ncbi:MAG TPA: 5'-3' exonuclease [Candidatus Dormibacteraeota bacterium]|jgi:5'-3' exonuclease|nr:5'-3' exonuclease [Candidatus Dormibacteraeota bacterium]
MPNPTLLLDSPSLFYRAFFALPVSIRDPQGKPVNAVRGYLDMVSQLLRARRPAGVVHVFDNNWRPAYRVAAYDGYKGARRPDPPEMPHQLELLFEVLAASGLPVADAEGYEADDAIGTLATRASAEQPVEVVTGDRDLLQLVRDPEVAVLFTVKGVKDLRRFDEAAVQEMYGVPPRLYVDFATMRGDTSDNLPGVPGIGPKTAAELLRRFGSLDALRRATVFDGISPRQHAALREQGAYLDAMRIVVPVDCEVTVRMSHPQLPDHDRLQRFAEERGLRGSIERLESAMALLVQDEVPAE